VYFKRAWHIREQRALDVKSPPIMVEHHKEMELQDFDLLFSFGL
jgi:hypothetical protein